MRFFPLILVLVFCWVPQVHAECYQGDCVDGRGGFRSDDDTIYIGHWQGGMYHGQGRIVYPNGSSYVGQWQAGKYHGHGVLTRADGGKTAGLFEDGVLVKEEIVPVPTPKIVQKPAAKKVVPQVEAGKVKQVAKKVVAQKMVPQVEARRVKKAVPVKQEEPPELPGKYPEASSRELTVADLEKMSPAEINIMLNEIYARHGHIFVGRAMQKYFSAQPWYKPSRQVGWGLLTDPEKANVRLIKKYRQEHK